MASVQHNSFVCFLGSFIIFVQQTSKTTNKTYLCYRIPLTNATPTHFAITTLHCNLVFIFGVYGCGSSGTFRFHCIIKEYMNKYIQRINTQELLEPLYIIFAPVHQSSSFALVSECQSIIFICIKSST